MASREDVSEKNEHVDSSEYGARLQGAKEIILMNEDVSFQVIFADEMNTVSKLVISFKICKSEIKVERNRAEVWQRRACE